MDEIPETLSELTEESKAWKKSADYRETNNAYLKIKNFLHKYSIGLSPP